MPQTIFPFKHYEKRLSYQRSLVVYLGAVSFCRLFMNSKDRTVDQMIQAARSGKQNIVKDAISSSFLLRKQITAQEQQFLKRGGIREQMPQARLESRNPHGRKAE